MNNICNIPFSQIELKPNGELTVCCKISNVIRKEDGTPFNLLYDSIEDVWNSEDLNKLRHSFLNGEKPIACRKCWVDEASGIQSLRLQSTEVKIDIDSPVIRCFSLKITTKCNCACRICDFSLSSLWESELRKQNRLPVHQAKYLEDSKMTKLDKNSNFEQIKEILPNLERLFIYGGEPLISKEVIQILEYAKDSGAGKNTRLIINTNGTVINDSHMSYFESFGDCALYFSVDDVGDRFEYERWPAKWSKVSENLKWVNNTVEASKVIKKSLYISISAFNILHIQEILDVFTKEFGQLPINMDNIIYDPPILCLYNMPEVIKPYIKDYIRNIRWGEARFEFPFDYCNNIIQFIDTSVSPYSPAEYIVLMERQLKADDIRRSQDWKETFKDLYNLLLSHS